VVLKGSSNSYIHNFTIVSYTYTQNLDNFVTFVKRNFQLISVAKVIDEFLYCCYSYTSKHLILQVTLHIHYIVF